MDKNELRRAMIRRRLAMAATDREEWDKRIIGYIIRLRPLREAKTVLLYLSIRGEVDTSALVAWAWSSGMVVAAPVVAAETKRMDPVAFSCWEEVQASDRGIPEPQTGRIVPPAEIDVAIVPGLAFTPGGYRLGYGGGYYDRFLPRLRPEVPVIAPAYHWQIVDRLPAEEHDHPVDLVVSERGIAGGTRAREAEEEWL